VGDVHGDYGRFLVLLQSAGIADRKGRATGKEDVPTLCKPATCWTGAPNPAR
jgi:hypothetical protein